jgi:RNA polymerase sigma-70 factor, ECF subfamily
VNPSGSASDEAVLVSRAKGGDRSALEALVRQNYGTVYRFLLSRVRDEDRAADLTQDTFMRASRSIENFRGQASFRTWLLTIATNQLRNSVRARQRKNEVDLTRVDDLPSPSEGPDVKAEDRAEIGRVQAMLDRLPEKQRLTVSLRLHDDLSFREIAEVLGSSEGSARVNFFHGIRRLRELLNESRSA